MLRTALLALVLGTPALAEEPAWPPEFLSIIEEDRSMCAGEFSVAPEAVVQRDLNGDGTPDWILDTAGFACSDSYGFYCGTQGCSVETLIDGTLGSLTLHSWASVTENGTTYLTAPNDQGETVRFLWTDSDWQLQ
jgi:hypothetical protein